MKRLYFIFIFLSALFFISSASFAKDIFVDGNVGVSVTEWHRFKLLTEDDNVILPGISPDNKDVVKSRYENYNSGAQARWYAEEEIIDDGGVRVYHWHGFDIEGACHWGNNDTSQPGFNFNAGDNVYPYDRGRAVGTLYETFEDADGNTWTDVLKLVPPTDKDMAHYKNKTSYDGYQIWTMIMTYPTSALGTYTLSMQVWVEESDEDVNIHWHNTTNWNDNILNVPVTQRGTWITIEETFTLGANAEIGILARGGGGNDGLRSATIYIKDLVITEPIQPAIEPLTTWDAFYWEGRGAPGSNGSGYQSSEAQGEVIIFEPGDGYSYTNVLKLEPPIGGYKFDSDLGGTVAMDFIVPYTGTYTLSMDVWGRFRQRQCKFDMVCMWRQLANA